MYAHMCARLRVADGQTHESAQKRFDAMLGVKGWAVPGTDFTQAAPADDAPWWWEGAEEASSSFLAAMGVNLD